jgi:hypothetical protein
MARLEQWFKDVGGRIADTVGIENFRRTIRGVHQISPGCRSP